MSAERVPEVPSWLKIAKPPEPPKTPIDPGLGEQPPGLAESIPQRYPHELDEPVNAADLMDTMYRTRFHFIEEVAKSGRNLFVEMQYHKGKTIVAITVAAGFVASAGAIAVYIHNRKK